MQFTMSLQCRTGKLKLPGMVDSKIVTADVRRITVPKKVRPEVEDRGTFPWSARPTLTGWQGGQSSARRHTRRLRLL